MEFFNEFWLIVRQHEYTYIAEKNWKFLFPGDFRGKTIFLHAQKSYIMLISVKTTGSILFTFLRQKKRIR